LGDEARGRVAVEERKRKLWGCFLITVGRERERVEAVNWWGHRRGFESRRAAAARKGESQGYEKDDAGVEGGSRAK
jgi:hypothetical protein